MLTVAFGQSTISRRQVQLWYNWFKEDREDINDNACTGLEMLTTFNSYSDLLKQVITGNESWVYGYDIESKA